MRKSMKWVAIIGMLLTVGLIFSPMAFAQGEGAATPSAPIGWTIGTSINNVTQSFTGTEAMIDENGTIQKIEKVAGVKDALQMSLKGETGNVWTVFLGPKWFIENQRIKLMAKDKVEVRGKKTGSMIIASEVSKGNLTMKLRNEEDGFPNWECCFPRKKM